MYLRNLRTYDLLSIGEYNKLSKEGFSKSFKNVKMLCIEQFIIVE
uniref:Uncharacterized protein n=1 Tax=Glaucocystis sp. BBH TaxID=2023628 RepID=A0A3G1IV69_9EUKA|nr:hypothetical protein [Glaucocystis sp. BBH]